MASFDTNKFEQAAEGITNAVAKKEYTAPITLLKTEVQDLVYEAQADQAVSVETTGRGLSIELSSGAFYKPASAEIRDEALPVLVKVAETLKAQRYAYYYFSAEGHTDDIPINTARFPSNWELSTGRATTVVRFLIEQGIDPEKLKASGFAETRPKAVNRDSQGAPIPANQMLNRRVTIEVTAMSLEEKKHFQMKAAAAAKEAPRASLELAPPGGAGTPAQPAGGTVPAAPR
jgi:chemotaxis protein MotB